jgi:[acyl-carrier-protein] S-malonyltransferase
VTNLALMFPGQGSQAVGMGCDLSVSEEAMRATFAEASEVLGYDLEKLCADGPADVLARTDVTQPALLAVSVGILRVLEGHGLQFAVAFGHSLGEYSALVATGAVAFADAVRLVRRRGEEMQAAAATHEGGMAAIIGLDDVATEELCRESPGVWPANYNSPGQVVVSGERAALLDLEAKAKLAGARRVVPLAVSGAFHSPLMEPALEPLRRELENIYWATPRPSFFSASSLAFESGGFPELLVRQVVAPVRFTQAVKALFASGYDAFLEVGPGSVLAGLVRRIVPEATVGRVSDAETLAAVRNDGRFWEAL